MRIPTTTAQKRYQEKVARLEAAYAKLRGPVSVGLGQDLGNCCSSTFTLYLDDGRFDCQIYAKTVAFRGRSGLEGIELSLGLDDSDEQMIEALGALKLQAEERAKANKAAKHNQDIRYARAFNRLAACLPSLRQESGGSFSTNHVGVSGHLTHEGDEIRRLQFEFIPIEVAERLLAVYAEFKRKMAN